MIQTETLVQIGDEALWTAIQHIRLEKEAAVNNQDYLAQQEWRDQEKRMLAALGGAGLHPFRPGQGWPLIQP